MTRIVITDHTFPALAGIEEAAQATGADLLVHREGGNEQALAEMASGADAVLVQYASITRAVLSAMPTGALVVRYGIGVDNIDLDAAGELGVQVANVPDYGTDVVADHATAMLLALCRRLPWYDHQVRTRGWFDAAEAGPFPSLAASTIGLLGGGRIATAVADRLRPFGCSVLAYDPYANRQALAEHGVEVVDTVEELFSRSDGFSLHAPATPSTYHSVNAERLALMRPHAVLVNTARGTLVDSAALLDALDNGTISAAALDVFEEEPLSVDSPLARHPQILHSPHAGFYSQQSLERLERLAAEEAMRHLLGQPLRCEVKS
jgi:D-3-phosphoglycerate dehydrogenase